MEFGCKLFSLGICKYWNLKATYNFEKSMEFESYGAVVHGWIDQYTVYWLVQT